MSIPNVPPGFRPLSEAYELANVSMNIIGVVVDFLEGIPTKGKDCSIKFAIHDPCFHHGTGLKIRVFNKTVELLPAIRNQGDIVILRNFKPTDWNGVKTLSPNSTSSWVVLEYASVSDSVAANLSDITVHRSDHAPHPNLVELRYAKDILELENPQLWPQPAKSTALQLANIMTENGGEAPRAQLKFREIKDCLIPNGEKHFYAELLAEHRKTWSSDSKVELYVTDYTENPFLFNYRHTDEDDAAKPFEGDQYGYIKDTYKLWPGPWGKMTMTIVLWPPHREWALKHVKFGDYVFLKNVRIKVDSNGGKIEGVCHTDNLYQDRIHVSIRNPSEAEGDENFLALLKRKKAYLEKCDANRWRFIRDARTQNRMFGHSDEPNQEEEAPSKGKKSRAQKRKEKQRNKDKAGSDDEKPSATVSLTNRTNEYVRCNAYAIPLTTISHITSPVMLTRTTPAGNPIVLPFQNALYKSRIRVLDFFPPSILDFCAPVRISEFAALSDGESESDVDPTQTDVTMTDADEDGVETGRVRWEWRFVLLVTDANPPKGEEPATMELLVADTDGDYLFRNIDACDLRDKRNKQYANRVREKLWVLWGDLEERKREAEQKAGQTGEEGKSDNENVPAKGTESVQPSARPFECFIKEYGIPSRGEGGGWERMWRLCHTCIA